MPLEDRIEVESVWTASGVRAENTSGTVLVSAELNNDGQEIPDIYTLTLSAVGGGTATVTVGTAAPNNPFKARVVAGVAIDGVTEVTNVIPGTTLVFSDAAADTNTADVFVGAYLGAFDASGSEIEPSAGVRHQVVNTGDVTITGCLARLMTMAVMVRKTGIALGEIRPFAENATEKVAGGGSSRTMPYALKVVNVSGAGSAKTADLQVDGVTVGAGVLLDLTTGDEVSGVGLKAVSPGYGYRFLSGPLEGLEFALSASCATNDIANVLIFPSRYIQIAPDVAGVAGAYAATNVVLTENGQSAGAITADGEAYYWVRILVPSGAGSESNPYPASVALQGNESGAAEWLG